VIDLNSDLGEGFGIWRLGDDAALLRLVSSANLACGFHAGDPSTMGRACVAAAAGGVAVGAHVGYRDLAGFGRRRIDYDPGELADDVLYQIGALDGLARRAGVAVGYVKPHGALYHAVWDDPRQARAVVAAIRSYDGRLAVLGQPGSALLSLAAEAGLRAVTEGFVDRAYTAAGTLVPRRDPAAVVSDPAAVAARAVRLAVDGEVAAVDGTVVPMRVESLCLHGDTPGAVALAGRVRAALDGAGVPVGPFAARPMAAVDG